MKINVSMNDELLARVDEYAKEQYLSRSGLISMACVQYLNQQEVVKVLSEMNKAMKRIAASGEIDDETKQQLEDFHRLCQLMMP